MDRCDIVKNTQKLPRNSGRRTGTIEIDLCSMSIHLRSHRHSNEKMYFLATLINIDVVVQSGVVLSHLGIVLSTFIPCDQSSLLLTTPSQQVSSPSEFQSAIKSISRYRRFKKGNIMLDPKVLERVFDLLNEGSIHCTSEVPQGRSIFKCDAG